MNRKIIWKYHINQYSYIHDNWYLLECCICCLIDLCLTSTLWQARFINEYGGNTVLQRRYWDFFIKPILNFLYIPECLTSMINVLKLDFSQTLDNIFSLGVYCIRTWISTCCVCGSYFILILDFLKEISFISSSVWYILWYVERYCFRKIE